MINFLLPIMKTTVLLGAFLALFRSSFAAIEGHARHDDSRGGQVVYQSSEEVQEHKALESLPSPVNAHQVLSDNDNDEPRGHSQERPSQTHKGSDSDPAPHRNPSVAARPARSQWAMVYFPYNDDSTCKSLLTVRSDIAHIARKGFTSIRLHASDCNALYKVGEAALLHNMKMILGVHIDETGLDAAQLQIEEMITWIRDQHQDQWDIVEMIVIGEETIFNEFLLPEVLAAFITSSRKTLRQAGFRGPVTTTEPIPTLYEHAHDLCPVIDVPAANIHPFFHREVSSNAAGAYVADALSVLSDLCPGKTEVVNLETGWPSRGLANGVAVPGRVEQMVAMEGIMRFAGARSVVLGFGDDGWKDEGDLGVEGAWGCEGLFEEI